MQISHKNYAFRASVHAAQVRRPDVMQRRDASEQWPVVLRTCVYNDFTDRDVHGCSFPRGKEGGEHQTRFLQYYVNNVCDTIAQYPYLGFVVERFPRMRMLSSRKKFLPSISVKISQKKRRHVIIFNVHNAAKCNVVARYKETLTVYSDVLGAVYLVVSLVSLNNIK